MALVALAQAAGISAAVPNPDGSRPQHVRGLRRPGRGELRRRILRRAARRWFAVPHRRGDSAGAQTRWAGIFAGVWLALLVLVAGSMAEIIPMPVIGGLILVIGVELVSGRCADITLVLRVAPLSAVAMLVTFPATTELPLHTAILIGVITSLVLYCAQAAKAAQLVALEPTGDGDCDHRGARTVRDDDVTVLHYAGVGLFAEVARIDEQWPRVDGSPAPSSF